MQLVVRWSNDLVPCIRFDEWAVLRREPPEIHHVPSPNAHLFRIVFCNKKITISVDEGRNGRKGGSTRIHSDSGETDGTNLMSGIKTKKIKGNQDFRRGSAENWGFGGKAPKETVFTSGT